MQTSVSQSEDFDLDDIDSEHDQIVEDLCTEIRELSDMLNIVVRLSKEVVESRGDFSVLPTISVDKRKLQALHETLSSPQFAPLSGVSNAWVRHDRPR